MDLLRRFLAWLTPGTRWLLAFWTAGCVLGFTAIGSQLALAAPAVRHGQVWCLVTYSWIPNNLMDFVISGIVLAILGGALERRWRARSLVGYILIVVVLAGATWSFLPFAGSAAWHGAGPLLFALLAAWGRICGNQIIYPAPSVPMTATTAAMIFGAFSLLMTAMTAGWRNALFAALGAIWGLAYLWVRSRRGEAAARPAAVSQRINRLEL